MSGRRVIAVGLMWLLCVTMAWAGGESTARAVTLIYTGNMDGELEPCGCSEVGNSGGLLRRATLIDRLRVERPELVLISAGGLQNPFVAHGQLTGAYILTGMNALAYDAVGVQWSDLVYGESLLDTVALPWVASNWRGERFAPERRITRPGYEVAFFAWLDPAAAPQRAMLGDHVQAGDDVAAISAALQRAQREGALTALATTLTLAEAERKFSLVDVDVLLVRANYEEFGEPVMHGHTLVLQPGSRGLRLGRVDLALREDGTLGAWDHEVMLMPPSVPDAPRLAPWYADYSARIKDNYLRSVALRKAQEQGETPFAGEEVCQSCHAEAYAKWSGSRHAHAYTSLEDVNKSFDPDCIQCHTVGFKQRGGFIDLETTLHLSNVQCESCHGAAREHAASGGALAVANATWSGPKMCAQCHTQPHSPEFDFARYWPKIAH